MANLQATQGNFNYSGITSILDYAESNQMKVRIGSLLSSLPSWFTTMSDANTVLTTLNTHISNVVSYLKTNYNNIIEYDLINDVFDNTGYKRNFLNNILSGSNVVSTVFAVANSVLGTSSRVKLLYNHSNAEEAYTNNTIISILSNFKSATYKYPIDGISLNISANSNVSFLRIENSIKNIRNLYYNTITLNSVNYSIPDTSITNLNEQARFYKALIEIKLNYNTVKTITLAGFNDADVVGRNNSVLFSNDTPKLAYSNIIDLYNTYDWNWLNTVFSRTLDTIILNDIDTLIRINTNSLLSYTPPTPSGGSITTLNLLGSSNIRIPNDFLALSQRPLLTDTYNFKFRNSFINLMNLFKLTKKSNMGMRFRCFLGITTNENDATYYSNKKKMELLNNLTLINGKAAIQVGPGKINSIVRIPAVYPKAPETVPCRPISGPDPADSLYPVRGGATYNSIINEYVQAVNYLVSHIDTNVFEAIEIFNEPTQMDGFGKEKRGVKYYKEVNEDIIKELNKNPMISNSIVLGSLVSEYYYSNDECRVAYDTNFLNGKIKSIAVHEYPIGGDKISGNRYKKLCKYTSGTKCKAINTDGIISSLSVDYLTSPNLPTIPGYKIRKGQINLEGSGKTYLFKSAGSSLINSINDINSKITKPASKNSETYPYGFHLNETNSVYNLGIYGISDVFASALWVVHWSLECALRNMNRINLHGGNDPRQPYNMIDYPDTYDINVKFDSIVNVRPIYYGYWFVHYAMQCGNSFANSKIMDSYIDSNKKLSVWKLSNSLNTTFVVIYYDYDLITNTIKCKIRAPNQSNQTSGKVVRLLCRNGLYGRSGVTFGNLSLDGTKDGIPYNVKNSSITPITLTEDGISSALEHQNFNSFRQSGIWYFEIPIQSPSAFILRV